MSIPIVIILVVTCILTLLTNSSSDGLNFGVSINDLKQNLTSYTNITKVSKLSLENLLAERMRMKNESRKRFASFQVPLNYTADKTLLGKIKRLYYQRARFEHMSILLQERKDRVNYLYDSEKRKINVIVQIEFYAFKLRSWYNSVGELGLKNAKKNIKTSQTHSNVSIDLTFPEKTLLLKKIGILQLTLRDTQEEISIANKFIRKEAEYLKTLMRNEKKYFGTFNGTAAEIDYDLNDLSSKIKFQKDDRIKNNKKIVLLNHVHTTLKQQLKEDLKKFRSFYKIISEF